MDNLLIQQPSNKRLTVESMDPEERTKWKEFKEELRSCCGRATHSAVLETIGSRCRQDEKIVDQTTFRERIEAIRGPKAAGGGIEQSLWMLRFRSTRSMDAEHTSLITKYTKSRISVEKEEAPPQFADNVQDALMKITSQFTDHINDAMHSDDQSPSISVLQNNPLSAVMQLQAIEANMQAIDHDMAVLDTNRKSGDDVGDLLVGFGCTPDAYSSSDDDSSSDEDESDSDSDSDSDDESGSSSDDESDDDRTLVDDSARISSGTDNTEVDALMRQMALEMGVSVSKIDSTFCVDDGSDYTSSEYDSDSDDESDSEDDSDDGDSSCDDEEEGEQYIDEDHCVDAQHESPCPMNHSIENYPEKAAAAGRIEQIAVNRPIHSDSESDEDSESDDDSDEWSDSDEDESDSEYESDESSLDESLIRGINKVLGCGSEQSVMSTKNDQSTPSMPRISEDTDSCEGPSVVPTENMTESSGSSTSSEKQQAQNLSLEDFFRRKEPVPGRTHLQKEALCVTEDKSCIISRDSREDNSTVDFAEPVEPFDRGDSKKRLLHGLSLSNSSLHELDLNFDEEVEPYKVPLNDESRKDCSEYSLCLDNPHDSRGHISALNSVDFSYRSGDLVCGWDDESESGNYSTNLLVDWNEEDCSDCVDDEGEVALPRFEPAEDSGASATCLSSEQEDCHFMAWPDEQNGARGGSENVSSAANNVERDGSASSFSGGSGDNLEHEAEHPLSQILNAQLPSVHDDMVWHVEIIKQDDETKESPFAFKIDPDVQAGDMPATGTSAFPKIAFSAKLKRRKRSSAPKNKHFDMMEDDRSKLLQQQQSRRRLVRRGSRVQFLEGLNYVAPQKARAVAMTMR